jgi:hypothetical protein
MASDNSLIFEKEKKFREFQIWPLAATLDVRSWVENFKEEHQDFALRLLDGFYFLSDPVIDAMLLGALQRLVSDFTNRSASGADFFQETLFVIVQGESPSVSDSGHIYARKLRDKAGVSEGKIKHPAEALKIADYFRNIVFVDDFIGSGQQMLYTWQRSHQLAATASTSFSELSAKGNHSFFYCATVCSSIGHLNLSRDIPELQIFAAHQLRNQDSLTYDDHPVWRGRYSESMLLLRQYSKEAGYDAEDGGEDDWRGFYRQALGLAYWHSVPDATLPVFRSARAGWKPLVRIRN